MTEDMKFRNFSPFTIKTYLSSITYFVRFYNTSPEALTEEDVRKYLLYLVNSGASWSTINSAQSALEILYKYVLRQSWKIENI